MSNSLHFFRLAMTGGLLWLFASASVTGGEPLFRETFDADIVEIGRNFQFETELILKHGHQYPGWNKQGRMPVHFVLQSPNDWALMLFSNAPGENTLTLEKSFAANEPGKQYTISVDLGPGVYAGGSQVTREGDRLLLELLRDDDSVLRSFLLSPRKWDDRPTYDNKIFTYEGDGSGSLRFRISPRGTEGRFYGAVDQLEVFATVDEAKQAVAHRMALAREREAAIARLGPVQRDWLFQADNQPTAERVRLEIDWSRQLARRLLRESRELNLLEELDSLDRCETKLREQDTDFFHLYLEVRAVKRRIALQNPAVDLSEILLVDAPYPLQRHESMHRQGYQTGTVPGRLVVVQGLDPDSPTRSVLPEGIRGHFWRPDVSFDGKQILFCMKPLGEKSFHLYEIRADGSDLKQLTFGDYDDLDPIYLPDGKILFSTTRGHTYVRCGPDHHAFVLARCDGDGRNIYIVSHGNEPDYLPSLMNDGRIIYTHWEYTDKEQKRVQSLWTMNPDGTNVLAFWGNQSVWPDMLVEPRSIPGSDRVMFTGVGHHLWFQGSLGIIDRREGMNYPNGMSKVTPELPWPEVGDGAQERRLTQHYHTAGRYRAYKTPYPISAKDFLVSIARPDDGKFHLYLMDICGNRELIHSGSHNVWHAIPLRARKRPPIVADRVSWPEIGDRRAVVAEGVLYSPNVFEGAPDIPRARVKYLRVIQSDYKTYTSWVKTYQHQGPSVSVIQADAVKRILGTTPVESDGSVAFKVPAGKTLHFQLLDEQFRCVQTMRSFTGVMPGEVRGCVGCHEGRKDSLAVPSASGIAIARGPENLTPPPWGAEESIGYMRFVQPVLDRYCAECHQRDGEAREKLDFTLRDSDEKWAIVQWPSAAAHYQTIVDVSNLPDADPWKTMRTGRTDSPFPEPYVTLAGGGNDWYSPTKAENFNRFGVPVSIAGCIIVEGYPERTTSALSTLPPLSHLSSASVLLKNAMDEEHIKTKMDLLSLRRLIAWIDCNGPYLGDEEMRRIPDPSFAMKIPLSIRPRIATAPVIDRFHIRQDGDSEAIVSESLRRRELEARAGP